jgi:hypothetical protein
MSVGKASPLQSSIGASNTVSARLPADDPNAPRPRLTPADGNSSSGTPLVDRAAAQSLEAEPDPQLDARRAAAAAALRSHLENANDVFSRSFFSLFAPSTAVLKVFEALAAYKSACEHSQPPEVETQWFDTAMDLFKPHLEVLFAPEVHLERALYPHLAGFHAGLTKLHLDDMRDLVEQAALIKASTDVDWFRGRAVQAGEDEVRLPEVFKNASYLLSNLDAFRPLGEVMNACADSSASAIRAQLPLDKFPPDKLREMGWLPAAQ